MGRASLKVHRQVLMKFQLFNYHKMLQGVSIDIDNDNQITDTWGDTLANPHDIALDRVDDAVYVVEIGPNRVRKFVKNGS